RPSGEPPASMERKNLENNLMAVHNLSSENIQFADETGGLAMPSLAVVRPDIDILENFGDITLLADSKVINPNKKNRVFAADVYSPRYPQVIYTIDNKNLRKLADRMNKVGIDGDAFYSYLSQSESNAS